MPDMGPKSRSLASNPQRNNLSLIDRAASRAVRWSISAFFVAMAVSVVPASAGLVVTLKQASCTTACQTAPVSNVRTVRVNTPIALGGRRTTSLSSRGTSTRLAPNAANASAMRGGVQSHRTLTVRPSRTSATTAAALGRNTSRSARPSINGRHARLAGGGTTGTTTPAFPVTASNVSKNSSGVPTYSGKPCCLKGGNGVTVPPIVTAAVREPAMLLIFGLGVSGLVAFRRRRWKTA
jgi:hypothetical protein